MPIVLKSGCLNRLEPSGPVKACNGIALPLVCPRILYDEVSHPCIMTSNIKILYISMLTNLDGIRERERFRVNDSMLLTYLFL
jgi:hypothetical protein